MSATYYGSLPVKRIVSTNIVGQGILIKTQKITASRDSASSLMPAINSVFEDDSSLWVTDSKLDDQSNGFAEITVVAQGPTSNPSTTLEIQPGGPFIYGLGGTNQVVAGSWAVENQQDYPSMANPSSGATVKVSFIDLAGQENQIIGTYSYNQMPATINGISLPSYKDPGIYGNALLLPTPGIPIPDPNWRVTYKGYVCKDIQIQRQGSALGVSLYFKESGFMEIYNKTDTNTATITKVWNY